MLEFARDRGGRMPRVFGVNHHPEVQDRARQLYLVEQKLERGEVSAQWVAERREALTHSFPDEDSEQRLLRTSAYTLLGPLRFHLQRQVRLRAESFGFRVDLHEDRVAAGAPA
jgi:predicted P-loop ATPase